MKSKREILWVAIFLFSFTGTGMAIPTTWTAFRPEAGTNHSDGLLCGPGGEDGFPFRHDITDAGFDPDGDSLSDNSLRMGFSGDMDCSTRERAWIDLPVLFSDRLGEINFESVNPGMSILGSVQLSTSGLLNVSIHRTLGDFHFPGSTVTTKGNDLTGTAPVPEPATLVLLGTGLIFIAGIGRKRFPR